MKEEIIALSEHFWSIRGVFKVAGILNIGTHASLVKQKTGKFILFDAYTLQGELKSTVDALTRDGQDIEAIINLHPFHTVHVRNAHQQYPKAKLYGTQRHLEKFPELPWQPELTDSDAFAGLFADEFEFSVPAGVDFISHNEHIHFSSVLAYHKPSRIIHADDTLMYLQLPGLLGKLKKPEVTFHLTLASALQKRPLAAQEFRAWAVQLAAQWQDAEQLCAAHSAVLLPDALQGRSIPSRIQTALAKVEKVLLRHEQKYG
jgi:hypothetical protein